MASFRILYKDGSIAKNTKVTISVENGGMAYGFSDDRGYVTITTSGTYGKIIVDGRTVHQGSLNINEISIN